MTELLEGPSEQQSVFARLVNTGQTNRENESEKVKAAQAFVNGGEWLAKQRDPFEIFQRMIGIAATIEARKLEDAHRQFERTFDPTIGSEGASKGFDLLIGLAMFRADPAKFYRTLVDAILHDLEDRTKPKETSENNFDKPIGILSLNENIEKKMLDKNDWSKTKSFLINNFDLKENKKDMKLLNPELWNQIEKFSKKIKKDKKRGDFGDSDQFDLPSTDGSGWDPSGLKDNGR